MVTKVEENFFEKFIEGPSKPFCASDSFPKVQRTLKNYLGVILNNLGTFEGHLKNHDFWLILQLNYAHGMELSCYVMFIDCSLNENTRSQSTAYPSAFLTAHFLVMSSSLSTEVKGDEETISSALEIILAAMASVAETEAELQSVKMTLTRVEVEKKLCQFS